MTRLHRRKAVAGIGMATRASNRIGVVHRRRRPGRAYRVATTAGGTIHRRERMRLGTTRRLASFGRRCIGHVVTSGLGASGCARHPLMIETGWEPCRRVVA